jgi:hypothetical protein
MPVCVCVSMTYACDCLRAEDDWKEAEYWRLFAEEMYEKAMSQAKRENDTDYQEVLYWPSCARS